MPFDEPFVGELMMVAFNYAPRGWTMCNGQLLPINQNQALFALLGTNYGGNGVTTFALPDLRGRVAISMGASDEGNNFVIGQSAGSESVTLSLNQLPAHTHSTTVTTPLSAVPACASADANQRTPVGNGFAAEASGVTGLYAATADADMASDAVRIDGPAAISSIGGSQPHNNVQPYLALTMCICLQGVFPSR